MLWILDWFWAIWGDVTDFFDVWYTKAKDVAENIWTWLWDNATMAYQWAIDRMDYYRNILRDEVNEWVEAAKSLAQDLVDSAIELVFYYIDVILEWLSLVQTQVDEIIDQAKQAALDLVSGLWGWLLDGLEAIWNDLVYAKDFVVNELSNAWNFITGVIDFFGNGEYYEMLSALKTHFDDLLLILQNPFGWLFAYLIDSILDILEEALADALEPG